MRGAALPNQGDDLADLLKKMNRRIRMLEERPATGVPGIGSVIPSWTPRVRAVTTAPSTVDSRSGYFMLTNIVGVGDWVMCSGWGVVRYAAAYSRGSGIYQLDLPFEPVLPNPNADPWYLMGNVSLGFTDVSGTHRQLGLTRNGFSGAGAAEGRKRACVISTNTDWLFADEANPKPGIPLGNVHWHFNYPIPRPASAEIVDIE